MDLVDAVYIALSTFPKSEIFCLSAQMRKAAVSIPANLAEGGGRYTSADQRHFYRQARGSAHELETEIEISMRQQFISAERGGELIAQTQKVCRSINALIRSMNTEGPATKGPGTRD
jgi:four helix bundle protein